MPEHATRPFLDRPSKGHQHHAHRTRRHRPDRSLPREDAHLAVRVDDLVLADLDADRAAQVADELGVRSATSIGELLSADLDGFVITAGTDAHADLIEAAVERGIPTFCEKPVALDLGRTLALAELERTSGVPVHIGFQRRFDAGYRRTRDAVAVGEIGFVHTIRAATMDQAPPPAAYLPTSGGLFRDCSVHDFDIIRFVTGREARTVWAVGANKGEPFFTEQGDVDTAAATVVLDDDTLVSVTATRYNGPATTCGWRCTARREASVSGTTRPWP